VTTIVAERSLCQGNERKLRDDYFYVQPSADILLTRYWSFGSYYLRRQNSGSVSTVDFYSNEAGVRTTIKF
jgi:hypothetical protein